MRKITADFIYNGKDTQALKDAVIVIDSNGRIEAISDRRQFEASELEYFAGAICPGFINAHCHLELSHLKGAIPTGTGLIPFITDVVTKRDFPPEVISECIQKADQEMWSAGIQAVGDISNTSDTFLQKSKSPIHYHSFIELFDLLQETEAEKSIQQGLEVKQEAEKLGIEASLTPHAPYSVSDNLLAKIVGHEYAFRLSIHNQETIPEDEFFQSKSGEFVTFYKNFNLSLDAFEATSSSSLQSILPALKSSVPTLFIHNSFTRIDDIERAEAHLEKVFWCTCPNANLYIENTLPSYGSFLRKGSKMVIGTDSLSSNWQLSILEEIKTLRKYHSTLDTGTLLSWACINGSEALGIQDQIGSFEVGKTPGILHLTTDENGEIQQSTTVERLV